MSECCDILVGLNKREHFRVLELYSGIGGMHYALREAQVPHTVVGAFDINTVANEIYRYNFKNCSHFQRNILSLTAGEVDKMEPDLLTMSPPCQPFTRLGLKLDTEDSRSSSFLHVLNLIKDLNRKPTYILLENVKGFETSTARMLLLDTLTKCNYAFQEFLLSPVQFGVPNSRLRYFILAKQIPLQFCFNVKDEVLNYIPFNELMHYGKEITKLSHYLENDVSVEQYFLPDKILQKFSMILDIVNKNDCISCCFTKAYGRYVQGTGSVLQHNNSINMSDVFDNITSLQHNSTVRLELLKTLGLRYFTPREVANLMCFPPDFKFLVTMSRRQKYQVLGNSINITVVSELLRLLLHKV